MQAKAKKTMEVNPKHCIASLLRRKAVSDETGATLQEGIWLLFYTSLMESCYTLEEPTQFAGRIRRMVLRGLCTDDADMGFGLDDDRPMMEGLQKKDPQADVVAQSAEGEDPKFWGVLERRDVDVLATVSARHCALFARILVDIYIARGQEDAECSERDGEGAEEDEQETGCDEDEGSYG